QPPPAGQGYARHPPTPMSPMAPTLMPQQPMQQQAMQAAPSPAPVLMQPQMPFSPPMPPSQPYAIPIPAAQPPPYLASQTASRAARPIEPWKDSLRLMMFLWGVALLAAFATPLATKPELAFNWTLVLHGEGTAKLPPLMLAAVGLLSVIVAGIPMQPAARG